jgi:hypothetical protein
MIIDTDKTRAGVEGFRHREQERIAARFSLPRGENEQKHFERALTVVDNESDRVHELCAEIENAAVLYLGKVSG